ncbi:YbfB/YjiJ family MFS transporter [Neptunomonas antarctica]|uniref:Predicted arabinose efflux permease, MFS family n=1 Tax=Neptunomonas antarctica TaxID=619304 RepID=A0A1N7JXZ1_9GAMM|nr:YbfB/YjiJ family MFS transporter [Neptunomonas antarctica]SIS54209.1 Predicted arabinose efflux permease, MFS family [Neptunomonas antarctica]
MKTSTDIREKYFVLAAGVISLILLLGVARFAYTPLIPIMQNETLLNDLSAGWLAAINYAGYMCGALIAASISDLMVKDRLYRAGLIIAIITTAGMALAENTLLWAVMRFFAGLSSAAGLLIGSGLVLNWLMRHHFRRELGIHFTGMGLGIVFTAIAVDLMINHFNWREQWLLLGAAAIVMAIPAWRWLPRPHNGTVTTAGQALQDHPPSVRFLWLMMASYFCAGFGYSISATFTVAMVERLPGLQGMGEQVWLVLGLTAIPAVLVWERIARKAGTLYALLLCYIIHILGIIVPIFYESLAGAMISAVLYGGTFIGIVSLVLTMAGRFYPTKPAKLMGKLTLSYGVAQIIAPAAAGMMAEQSGDYVGGLIMAAGMMVIGTLILLILISTENQSIKTLDAA